MPEEIKEDLPQEDVTPEETPEIKTEEVEEVPEQVKDFLQTGGKEPVDEEEVVEEVVEPDKEEDKPAEAPTAPVETPQPQAKPEEKPIAEVIEETTEKVLEKAGIIKEEPKEEGFKYAWEERGEDKPATWQEADKEFTRRREWEDSKVAEVKQVEIDKKAEADTAFQTEAEAEWDRQLTFLRDKKYIPSIAPAVQAKIDGNIGLTSEDAKDPGVVAQRELFLSLGAAGRGRAKPIIDLVHVYHEFYKPSKAKKQPAGADAPVSAGTPGVTTGKDDDELSYPDLKNMSFEEIIRAG